MIYFQFKLRKTKEKFIIICPLPVWAGARADTHLIFHSAPGVQSVANSITTILQVTKDNPNTLTVTITNSSIMNPCKKVCFGSSFWCTAVCFWEVTWNWQIWFVSSGITRDNSLNLQRETRFNNVDMKTFMLHVLFHSRTSAWTVCGLTLVWSLDSCFSSRWVWV